MHGNFSIFFNTVYKMPITQEVFEICVMPDERLGSNLGYDNVNLNIRLNVFEQLVEAEARLLALIRQHGDRVFAVPKGRSRLNIVKLSVHGGAEDVPMVPMEIRRLYLAFLEDPSQLNTDLLGQLMSYYMHDDSIMTWFNRKTIEEAQQQHHEPELQHQEDDVTMSQAVPTSRK